MSKKTLEKWWQGFRTALPFACLVVLALVIRWSTWSDAYQAGHAQGRFTVKQEVIEAARQAYEFGKRDGSCPARTQHENVILEDTIAGYRDRPPQSL